MSKVFGFTKLDGKHWFVSDAYSDKEIESIKDPEGGSEIQLPTAIPTPFARFDLVKTAFKNIANTPHLTHHSKDGAVIASLEDEKLVSDALDLAELLFNYDSVREHIRILNWNKEEELKTLKRGSNEHRRFAETLQLYLNKDAAAYNFDQLQSIYLVEYDHQFIGCTSPVTLFCTTANSLKSLQLRLTANDVLFDEKYVPLHQRDPEFQRYMYGLFKAHDRLRRALPAIDDYLDRSLKLLKSINPDLHSEINKLESTSAIDLYEELESGTAGSIVEIFGVPLRKRKRENIVQVVSESDFVIRSPKYQQNPKPLVLQNNFPKSLKYATDTWKSSYKVPPYDPESRLLKRKLPEINLEYPYLTVSDFLEPYLIRVVYPINDEKFFDGNLIIEVGNDKKGYLLPIKPTYFQFFDVSDLLGTPETGKKAIELIQLAAGAVKVILRVPIKKGGEFITFERIYFPSDDPASNIPDEMSNKGVVREFQVGITVFPFVRIPQQQIKPHFRIQLIDRDLAAKTGDFDLQFYGSNLDKPLDVRAKKQRNIKGSNISDATTQYYVLNENFDYIRLLHTSVTELSALIIPKWREYIAGNKEFTFAIDFGTTNTHIEYKVDGTIRPFTVSLENSQIAPLFHSRKTTQDFAGTGALSLRERINYEFVPESIGADKSAFKFPIRTVVGESKSLNIALETFALADFNIPFTYEKIQDSVNEIKSNLKWAKKEPGNDKRVRAFFETLMMIMRSKVLLENGNLGITRLIWFYPSSMKPSRKADMEMSIKHIFKEYFSSANEPVGIVESLAPFYFYKAYNRLPGGAFTPVVSIDIGGGTTDVVVFRANKPILLSSFKFAANSIFGTGFYDYDAGGNAIVTKYLSTFQERLSANKLYNLEQILNDIKDRNKSDDLSTFLFSLENNQSIADKELFSYNKLLSKDEDLKILFIYFYTAIVYHIAELMKYKGVEMPKHIVFSGTGSKMLSIISPQPKLIERLSMLIFESVYNKDFEQHDLTIAVETESPKEVTCRGGLMTVASDLAIDITSIKEEFTCLRKREFEKISVGDLNDETKNSIVEYIRHFNHFFINLDQKINFNNYFDVSHHAFDLFKNNMNQNLRDFLEDGIEFNRRLDDGNSSDGLLEETLFFYPITGVIHNLANLLKYENA